MKNKQLHTVTSKALNRFMNLSYSTLFLLWLLIAFVFGLAYFCMSLTIAEHAPAQLGNSVTLWHRLFDSMYYSVTTATSVGYGDITPQGFSKFLAGLQSILALLVFATFVSKLVSHKQEVALEQVHKLTFENLFHHIREGLFIVRKDFDKIIYTANTHKKITEKDWRNVTSGYAQIQILLEEIPTFYKEVNEFYTIDERRETLLQEVMYRTLDRLNTMLNTFSANGIEWHMHKQSFTELQTLIRLLNSVHKHWHKVSPYEHKEAFAQIIEAQNAINENVKKLAGS